MKFKNAIFATTNFIETVNKCNDYEDFSPKDSYRFNRFVKKLASFGEDFEEVRVKLIKKYGEKDEQGNFSISADDTEKVKDFQIKFNELLNIEFEIEGINKVKFPMELKLSPKEMGMMEEVFDMSELEEDFEKEEDKSSDTDVSTESSE
tara:strand:- start:407 stop:853 length:447 start_codon:yes stop_codon:yes gene_type:complete